MRMRMCMRVGLRVRMDLGRGVPPLAVMRSRVLSMSVHRRDRHRMRVGMLVRMRVVGVVVVRRGWRGVGAVEVPGAVWGWWRCVWVVAGGEVWVGVEVGLVCVCVLVLLVLVCVLLLLVGHVGWGGRAPEGVWGS